LEVEYRAVVGDKCRATQPVLLSRDATLKGLCGVGVNELLNILKSPVVGVYRRAALAHGLIQGIC